MKRWSALQTLRRWHVLHAGVALYMFAVVTGGCDRITGLSDLEKAEAQDDDATSGAGGAGGAGGEMPGTCELRPEDSDCLVCLKETCCESLSNCAMEPECFCVLDCMGFGGSLIECTTMCAMTPSPAIDLLVECSTSGCFCL